jgi:hypothetical protein
MKQQKKGQQPKPQPRKERDDERAVMSKHLHPPKVETFKTSLGVVIRF